MRALRIVHTQIKACRLCPNMVGRPVHGSAIHSPVFLLGQAPGPHEESRGKPFAHTAGKTLFRWFEETAGVSEEHFRSHIYMAAVARCYPGKGKGAGDRLPDRTEIANCRPHIEKEIEQLSPKLILPVGKLAISEVLGPERYTAKSKLTDVVGKIFEVTYGGAACQAICLPHPSGLSSWHKTEPGKQLLAQALSLIAKHPAWREAVE